MFASFEEKGKIFTPVVSKNPVNVIIQTNQSLIHGQAYVRPDGRLIDELNRSESFIAITDARIEDLHGNELYKTTFMLIHWDQIHWLIPSDEIEVTEK